MIFLQEKWHRSSRTYTSVEGYKELQGRGEGNRSQWKNEVGHLGRGRLQRIQWHRLDDLRSIAHGTRRYCLIRS